MPGSSGIGGGVQLGVGHIVVTPQLHQNFGSQLNGSITQQMTQAGRQGGTALFSSVAATANAGPVRARFGAIGRGLAGAVVAGFAAVGVGKAIGKIVSTGVDEVKDYQAGLARLQAGLKSTGNQAGLSAGQMEDLASQIEAYSGQTDDSIVATEQLLLTFTNIKNVAGAGNDIFTQTTKIAADMAARLGGDASTAAVQLGKALNDPVKGVTALTRVGVSFDKQQTDTIKTLVTSGKTLDAQKIILKELNKEFGGSAKAVGDTLPGQIERAKRSFEGLSQSVVTAALPAFNAVLPSIQKFLGWIGPKLETGVNAAVGGIRKFTGGVKEIIGGFRSIGGAGDVSGLARVGQVIRQVFDGIRSAVTPAVEAVGAALRDLGTFVTRDVVPSLQNMWRFIGPTLLPVLRVVGTVLIGSVVVGFRALGRVLVSVVGPALRAVTGFFAKHRTAIMAVGIFIGTVLVPVLTLMAARYVYTRLVMLAVNGALLIVNGALKAMAAIQAVVNAVMNANPFVAIATLLIALGAALVYAYNHSKTFRDIVQAVFRAVAAAGQWMWSNVLKPVFEALKTAWDAIWKAMQAVYTNVIHPLWTGIQVYIGIVWAAVKIYFKVWQAAFEFLWAAARFVWDNIGHPIWTGISSAVQLTWTITKGIFDTLGAAWSGLMSGMSTVYNNVLKPIWGFFEDGVSGIASAVGWVVGAIETVWGKLGDILAWPVNHVLAPIIRNVAHAIDAVLDFVGIKRYLQEWENWQGVGGGGPNPMGQTGDPTKVGHHATGAFYPGYGGGDRHRALLESGEVVVRKEAAARFPGGAKGMHDYYNRGASGSLASNYGGPFDFIGDIGHAITHNPVTDFIGGAAKSLLGGAFDLGKWVLSEAAGLLRRGAAAAFDTAYKVMSAPLFALLPGTGWGKTVRGIPDTIEKKFVDWMRGKESDPIVGSIAGGTGVPWDGGPFTVPLIEQLAGTLGVPGLSVTSTVRAGERSYHGAGEAVDFSNGPGYGPGSNTPQELAFDLAWAKMYGSSLAELIHAAPGAINIKDGRIVDGMSFYGPATMMDHWNHVHVAISPESIARGSHLGQGTHDRGGWLGDGEIAFNRSGRPEAVLSPDETAAFKQLLANAGGGGGLFAGANVTIGDNADLDLYDRQRRFRDRMLNV